MAFIKQLPFWLEWTTIVASLAIPSLAIVGCILWMTVFATPSFGNVIGLIISLIAFVYGSCTANTVYANM